MNNRTVASPPWYSKPLNHTCILERWGVRRWGGFAVLFLCGFVCLFVFSTSNWLNHPEIQKTFFVTGRNSECFAWRFFKFYTFMDFIVVILNMTYLTSGRVTSVLADNISESMDVVLRALSFPSVQWG